MDQIVHNLRQLILFQWNYENDHHFVVSRIENRSELEIDNEIDRYWIAKQRSSNTVDFSSDYQIGYGNTAITQSNFNI
jgi:hypothetical protein